MEAAAERPRVYTIEEAAVILRISRSSAYAGVADKSIPSIKIGARRLLVPAAALDRLLEGQP